MEAVAEHIDKSLTRAPSFSRYDYEGGEGYLFVVGLPIDEGSDDPAELWIATIQRGTPEELAYFKGGDRSDPPVDFVAWPNEAGVYGVVNFMAWTLYWHEEERRVQSALEHDAGVCTEDAYRPAHVPVIDRTFDAGLPVEPEPSYHHRVSVYEHLRRNLTVDMSECGKEVNEMAATKKPAKKATKTVKKPTKKPTKKPAKKKG